MKTATQRFAFRFLFGLRKRSSHQRLQQLNKKQNNRPSSSSLLRLSVETKLTFEKIFLNAL